MARVSEERTKDYAREVAPYLSRHRSESHKLAPERSALFVIDMQRLFLDRSSRSFLPDSDGIVENVLGLIEAYRERALPIVFTRHALGRSESAGAMGRWWPDVTRDGDAASEIDPRFVPRSDEMVIRKSRYSAFVGTDLERQLRERDVTSLVITGVMTHLCCDSTARDAFMRDFDVFLVVDGTASKTEDLHVSSMKALSDGFAIPMTSSEVLTCLRAK